MNRHQYTGYSDVPANAGKPWTPQMDDELRALTTGKNTVEQIAAAMGRTRPGIVARQQYLGLTPSSGETP
jgi:hypothetical protein